MGDSRSSSRPYQLSMAVICTFLASSGFIAAGYADNSTADAAISMAAHNISLISSTHDEAAAIGFDPATVLGSGVKMSFAQLFIRSRMPAAQQLFDLTDPNDGTPPFSRGVSAMDGNVPELSMDMISKVRRDIVTAAYWGLGHRYVWGGTSFENGWDCSGFVQWAYAQAGIALPRTEQWVAMVKTNTPQPGDIVVQNPDGPNHWSHIGIYIGNGKMISALNPSVGTLIHAPGDVSSSSTYFTVPAFAAADGQARADAAAKKVGTPTSGATDKPNATKPAVTAPATTAPATTAPATTAPSGTPTAPATTAPSGTPTAPSGTPTAPATTPATTAPATTPATTAPATTPATTAPASETPQPATTDPVETTEASDPPASSGTATASPSAVNASTGTWVADPTAAPSTTTPAPGSQTPTVPSP